MLAQGSKEHSDFIHERFVHVSFYAVLKLMERLFVRPTYWPPGMVRHCPYVCHTFMYHDAPSVIKSDPPFSSIDAHMNWNWRTISENDSPNDASTFNSCMTGRTSDTLMVHWLIMTHIWVNLWLTFCFHDGTMCHQYVGTWRTHDAPFPGVNRWVLQMTVP